MKELTLSKRNLSILIVILLFTVLGIFLIQRFVSAQAIPAATPSAEETEAAKAAVAGAKAFFQIDLNAGQEAWLKNFCAISTENGCALVRMGADRLWKKYGDGKTSIQVEATALKRISKKPEEQVWQISIHLSNPLPGSNKTEDEAYVLVIKSSGAWKFDRFLLEPEVQALQERQKQGGQQ